MSIVQIYVGKRQQVYEEQEYRIVSTLSKLR